MNVNSINEKFVKNLLHTTVINVPLNSLIFLFLNKDFTDDINVKNIMEKLLLLKYRKVK